MRRTISTRGQRTAVHGLAVLAFATLATVAAACGGDKEGGATSGASETKPVDAPVAAATTAKPAMAPVSAPTPTTSAAAAATGAPSATPAATTIATAAAQPAASGSAAAGAKTFDCGAKGQKLCPMQGWMKGVMAAATASGDGEKLAAALSYVASRTPPGFGSWSSMASAGAAKAKAGDIDGAKASCKVCHDAYKEKYKTTMRDRPF